MQRSIVLAAVAAATVLTATAANAGRVDWSIGINVPPIAAVVGAPAYYPAPAYYNAPTYYDNPPAYYAPPVVYAPRPRSWLPPPPLPAGATQWFTLTVTLKVHDDLGNVSAEVTHGGARVFPQGVCGY